MLSLLSAVIMLVLALIKDQSFFSQLHQITKANLSSIKFENLQILVRELVNLANQDEDDYSVFIPGKVSAFLQQELIRQSELFRMYQNDLDTHTMGMSNVTLQYIRRDGEYYEENKSYSLAFYEVITMCQEIGQTTQYDQLTLRRSVLLNHDRMH